MPYATEAERWRALTIRDPQANGQFVYAVKSTLCYCRPTCPARLARRANVEFYETAFQAEAAGYRACKRCKPDEETHEEPADKAVAKACNLIQQAILEKDEKALQLQGLAKSVGLTPRYFHKIFKDKMKMTPTQYVKSKRGKGDREVITSAASDNNGVIGGVSFDDFDFGTLTNFDAELSATPEEEWEALTPEFSDLTSAVPGSAGRIQASSNAHQNARNQNVGSGSAIQQFPSVEHSNPQLQFDAGFGTAASVWQSYTPLAHLISDLDLALLFQGHSSEALGPSGNWEDNMVSYPSAEFQDFIWD
jgi:methylphosphotriester-DNA--protein-cysteine methyltransferase